MKQARPFAPFEWMMAWRYLRAKRAESFISVITVISLVGIAIGVAALIIVTAVMNGFRHDLMNRILGFNGHVTIQSMAGGLMDYDAVAARVRQVPGVIRIAPVIENFVGVSSNGITTGAQVRGIRAGDLDSLTMVSKSLKAGALDRFAEDSVIIGIRMADQLGLDSGMSITLLSPHGDVTPFGVTPRVKTYAIAGLFNVGMSQFDQSVIFMPLDQAQAYFGMGDTVSSLEVMVADPDKVADMADALRRAAGPGTRALTWRDTQSTFFAAVQVEHVVMFLILTLIIIVAALNIVSGLYMLVRSKSADIAILRTMGASRGAVMRIFMIGGLAIGFAGTFAGFLIGVLFCANIESIRLGLVSLTGVKLFDSTIYFLSHMPADMDPLEVALIIVMALLLSFLATLYPSWRAARLDPVEALRYE